MLPYLNFYIFNHDLCCLTCKRFDVGAKTITRFGHSIRIALDRTK